MAVLARPPHRAFALLLSAFAALSPAAVAAAAPAAAPGAAAGGGNETQQLAPNESHIGLPLLAKRDARRLQEQTYGVTCPENYQDQTGGQAYLRDCGVGCTGGAFVTAGCECACVPTRQILCDNCQVRDIAAMPTTTTRQRLGFTTTKDPNWTPPPSTPPPQQIQYYNGNVEAKTRPGTQASTSLSFMVPGPRTTTSLQLDADEGGMSAETTVILVGGAVITAVVLLTAYAFVGAGKLSKVTPEDAKEAAKPTAAAAAPPVHITKAPETGSEVGSDWAPSLRPSEHSSVSNVDNRLSHVSTTLPAAWSQDNNGLSVSRNSSLSQPSPSPMAVGEPRSSVHSNQSLRVSARSDEAMSRSVSPAASMASRRSTSSYVAPRTSQSSNNGHRLSVSSAPQHRSPSPAASVTSHQSGRSSSHVEPRTSHPTRHSLRVSGHHTAHSKSPTPSVASRRSRYSQSSASPRSRRRPSQSKAAPEPLWPPGRPSVTSAAASTPLG